MKIKSNYVLHDMGGEYVVVAVEDRTKEFCGMIRLNETGAFLWKQMSDDVTKEFLTDSLVNEYNITTELAKEAIEKFLQQLSGVDVIEQ